MYYNLLCGGFIHVYYYIMYSTILQGFMGCRVLMEVTSNPISPYSTRATFARKRWECPSEPWSCSTDIKYFVHEVTSVARWKVQTLRKLVQADIVNMLAMLILFINNKYSYWTYLFCFSFWSLFLSYLHKEEPCEFSIWFFKVCR